MEKDLKHLLIVFSVTMIFGVWFAINYHPSDVTSNDELELIKIIQLNNADLPRKIGTIGSLDSIVLVNRTIVYNFSVNGSNSIQKVYSEHYDEFADLLKYTFLVMNGQFENGTKFVKVLDAKGINLGCNIYTADKSKTSWTIKHSDLISFMDSCKVSPTEALNTTIDMHLAIANLDLPVTANTMRDIESVPLNSTVGEIDEKCLLQKISHKKDSVIIEYSVDETEYCIDSINETYKDQIQVHQFTQTIAEDEDMMDFLGLVTISHSILVLKYVGRDSQKIAKILIPYNILKIYSELPFQLEDK